ncbi:MAG: EAL domain-containing protein [Gammaproteobacteria bacterium]|nr:EAL domain-containing protein [Gammaproteobacteria bacterium]
MQDTLFRTDLDGRILWVSPSVRTLLEYTAEELRGRRLSDLHVHDQDYLEFRRTLDKNGLAENHPVAWKRADNRIAWVSVNAQYYYSENDVIAGIEGSARDITERKLAEEALFQEKERAQITLRSIGDGVITTNVTGAIEYLNPTAEQLIGCSLDEARSRALPEVITLIDNTTGQTLPDPAALCLREGRVHNLSGHILLVRQRDNKSFSVEVTAAPIHDSTGHVTGTVLVLHDVTELRGLVHKMSYQASHDALTGLINRREFEARLARVMESARDHGLRHALCYMDLDQFKIVNDTCGHAAGDELLKLLAVQLQERIRETDTLARLGGDEFGVLLEGCPLDRAHEIAEVLRRTVEDFHFYWKDKVFRVGASIGLVPITADSGELSDVLSAADSACYVAKEQGRNRVRVFQPDDTALAQRSGEMHWVQRIQWALEENRFRLYFQPIVPIKNGEQKQYIQILLRLMNEHQELVSPHAFLPAAERYHMMPAIDRWVVSTALRTLSRQGTPLNDIALCIINLSGQSLTEESFLDFVVEQLETTGVTAQRLCFQVPESAIISHLARSTHFISTLKRLGCHFSLANFGSGLSSFGYLKALNVDYLKLDGNFVKGMVQDPVDRAMVRAVNQLGHALGVRTIAEFVENEATFKSLRLLNVDYVQGYWLDQPRPFPPSPADEIISR